MRFVKYHGLGNDFIVVDSAVAITPELAVRLCRRGFGIGADGLMRVTAPTSPGAHVTMDLINSDGSLPEMCGNGIRCLVKHAVDVLGQRHNPLVVDTPAGPLACQWTARDGKVSSVRVAMGRPRFDFTTVPVDPTQGTIDGPLLAVEANGRSFAGLPVNTGNPHFAIFGDASPKTAVTFGPELETHAAFPAKANIEFVEVVDAGREGAPRLRVTVWERGCGLTHACGTGATAATAAAMRLGHITSGHEVAVDLPGGTLVITIASDFTEAYMDGPVALAFSGEVD